MAAVTQDVAMGGQAGAPGTKNSSFQLVNALMKMSLKLVNAIVTVIIAYAGLGVLFYGLYIFDITIPLLDTFFGPVYELYKILLHLIMSPVSGLGDELLLIAFLFIWIVSLSLIIAVASNVAPFTTKVFSRITRAVMPASWHLENGKTMMNAGNYQGATAEFNAALKKSPGYPGAYYNLGYVSMKTSQFENAVSSFHEELKVNPAHFDSRLNAGYCYLMLGRANSAIAELQEAVRLNPGNGLAHAWLGAAYRSAGQYSDALQAYQAVKTIAPDMKDLDRVMGEIHLELGMLDDAIVELKVAANKAPGDDQAHYRLGLAYGKKGRYEDAIAEYNAAIRINPQNTEYKDMLELAKSYLKSVSAGVITQKEIIKEIIKVPCEYCHTLVDVTQAKCPSCGAPLRG